MILGFSISLKGTNAYFGDPSGTGSLGGNIYSVFYYRNWPNIDDVEIIQNKKYNITKILSYEELFTPLDDYEFIGWNTSRDGSGNYYNAEHVFTLTADLNLYAQWKLLVSYGDTNEDGTINEDDYLLIENYLNNKNTITDKGMINADVNNDRKIDIIDVDIIKQVCLKTVGYVGYLPNKPILIYEIYEGNIDIGTDNPKEDTDNDSKIEQDNNEINNNENITSGTGNGQTGNGNNNSGNGNGGTANGNNSTPNDGYANDDIKNEDDTDNDESNNKVENKFKFKFMNGNLEYASSECLIDDGKCLVIFPKEIPHINRYRFTGWSEDKGCPNNKGIIRSVYVDSDKTYYACFEDNKNKNNQHLWIIVLSIVIIAISLIWNLISNFKNNNSNNIEKNIDSSQ